MNLQTTKIHIVKKILAVSKPDLLDKINVILDKEMIVGYTADGLPLTKENYNKRLKIAESQIAAGKYMSQEELEKESENW